MPPSRSHIVDSQPVILYQAASILPKLKLLCIRHLADITPAAGQNQSDSFLLAGHQGFLCPLGDLISAVQQRAIHICHNPLYIHLTIPLLAVSISYFVLFLATISLAIFYVYIAKLNLFCQGLIFFLFQKIAHRNLSLGNLVNIKDLQEAFTRWH